MILLLLKKLNKFNQLFIVKLSSFIYYLIQYIISCYQFITKTKTLKT